MHLQDSIGEFLWHTNHRGLRATLNRMLVGFRRVLAGNRLVLFCCDLADFQAAAPDELTQGNVVRRRAESEMQAEEMLRIVHAGYPPVVRRRISERFARGASLWLFELEDKLVAYGWTLCGQTVESHFFPLGTNDVHLFDFFVFPEYRGRRINPSLVKCILMSLAREGKGRVFIEAAEWNTSQLRSLSRMPFQKLGCARKYHLFGRTVVVWSEAGRTLP